jgi:hypothetical protein
LVIRVAPEGGARLRDTRVANTADFNQDIRDRATYNSTVESDERIELLTIIDEETDRLNLLVGEAVEGVRLDNGERFNLEPRAIEETIDAARKDCRALLAHTRFRSGSLWGCRPFVRI